MLTEQNAVPAGPSLREVQKEKNEIFNNIRHMIAKEHSCPKHLTMVDLKVILAILEVKQYDNAE